MIFLFHGLYFLLKYLHKNYKRRQILNVSSLTEKPVVGDVEFNLKFDPPVYKLRYSAVQEILIENNCDGKIKKVLEYGCAEMKFLFYLKRLYGINEVLLVDVDEPLLQENLFRVQPQSTDFLDGRSEPLIVSVLSGSISDPDCKVLGADAVIGIEIIEHLYPDILDEVPYTVFGYIQPKIVIFTTPNADFNVLFSNFKGLRHDDHKFEWTRKEFEAWALNITIRFPQYSVEFQGVGDAPKGYKYLGYCSQIAVFKKQIEESMSLSEVPKLLTKLVNSECATERNNFEPNFGTCKYFSYSLQIRQYEHDNQSFVENQHGEKHNEASNIYFKLLNRVEYPFQFDNRTVDEKILHEALYNLHCMGTMYGMYYNEQEDRSEVPLYEIISNRNGIFTSEEQIKNILESNNYMVEECLVHGRDRTLCVIYNPIMAHRSSTPTSDYTDKEEEDREINWPEIQEDWDLEYSASCSVKNENDNKSEKPNTKEIIGEILNSLQSNVNVEIENKYEVESNQENSLLKSNSEQSTPTENVERTVEKRIVLEHKLHRAVISDENEKLLKNKNNTELRQPKTSKQDELNKTSHPPSTSKKTGLNSIHEPIAGTSNIRKKKKKKTEEELCKEEIKNLAQTIVYHSLNKIGLHEDSQGNESTENINVDYDLIQSNSREQLLERKNQNIVTSTPKENISNASSTSTLIPNQAIPVTTEEEQSIQERELAHASREALFDPSSEVSILDDFTEQVAAAGNMTDTMLTGMNRHHHQQNLILIGVNMNTNENEHIMLPLNPDPFPNWLLQLLGANALEGEAESHDEPHFYCQGDGIGVHPSIVEVDLEEELSSSDSSASNGDEAEQTVSDPDVAQIPEDNVEENVEENSLEIAARTLEIEHNTRTETSSNPDSTDEFFDIVDSVDESSMLSITSNEHNK